MIAPKAKSETGLRFKTYSIIRRAIEEGVEAGVNRAIDKLEIQIPRPDEVRGAIEDAVMLALDDILLFPEDY